MLFEASNIGTKRDNRLLHFKEFQHFQRETSAVCSLQRNTGRVQPTTEIEPEGLRRWLTRQMKNLNMLSQNI